MAVYRVQTKPTAMMVIYCGVAIAAADTQTEHLNIADDKEHLRLVTPRSLTLTLQIQTKLATLHKQLQ